MGPYVLLLLLLIVIALVLCDHLPPASRPLYLSILIWVGDF